MLPRAFDVEQHNIEGGIRRDSRLCALGDALQEHVPKARHISIDLQAIKFSIPQDDKRYIFMTPKNAQEFILAFDRGEELQPIRVVLGKPVRVQAMRHEWEGNLDTLQKIRENERRRKGKTRRHITPVRRFGIRMLQE